MNRTRILTIIAIVVMVSTLFMFSGCRESDKVTYNVSKEADNFNVMRRLTVINTVTDTPEFEIIGRFSITADREDEQLEIVVEVAKDKYKKHIIGLNQATTMYVVEDINGAKVNKYEYEINYQPESIVPLDVVKID